MPLSSSPADRWVSSSPPGGRWRFTVDNQDNHLVHLIAQFLTLTVVPSGALRRAIEPEHIFGEEANGCRAGCNSGYRTGRRHRAFRVRHHPHSHRRTTPAVTHTVTAQAPEDPCRSTTPSAGQNRHRSARTRPRPSTCRHPRHQRRRSSATGSSLAAQASTPGHKARAARSPSTLGAGLHRRRVLEPAGNLLLHRGRRVYDLRLGRQPRDSHGRQR